VDGRELPRKLLGNDMLRSPGFIVFAGLLAKLLAEVV
jgi:hypothetical protein